MALTKSKMTVTKMKMALTLSAPAVRVFVVDISKSRILGNAFGDTEKWIGTFASEVPEGLFRCCFQCPANAGFCVFSGALPERVQRRFYCRLRLWDYWRLHVASAKPHRLWIEAWLSMDRDAAVYG